LADGHDNTVVLGRLTADTTKVFFDDFRVRIGEDAVGRAVEDAGVVLFGVDYVVPLTDLSFFSS